MGEEDWEEKEKMLKELRRQKLKRQNYSYEAKHTK